jgi:hypothetical protein
VTISPFNGTFGSSELEPNIFLNVVGTQIIESFLSIPTSKNKHEIFVHDSTMAKSEFGTGNEDHFVEHGSWTFNFVGEHYSFDLVAVGVRARIDFAPLV